MVGRCTLSAGNGDFMGEVDIDMDFDMTIDERGHGVV